MPKRNHINEKYGNSVKSSFMTSDLSSALSGPHRMVLTRSRTAMATLRVCKLVRSAAGVEVPRRDEVSFTFWPPSLVRIGSELGVLRFADGDRAGFGCDISLRRRAHQLDRPEMAPIRR